MGEPLSENDIRLVQATWKPVTADLEGNGVIILKTFLDKHDYYSKFERFRDHPRESIVENAVFKTHCLNLMRYLNDIIENLDNPEKLGPLLTSLGQRHGRKNIEMEHFENLKIVILDILSEAFSISNEEQEAWSKALTAAQSLIYQGLNSV